MRTSPDAANYSSVPAYNDWLDANFATANGGPLEILGRGIRPSQVAHQMAFHLYQASFPEFKREWEEQLIEKVTRDFPIVIAHPFDRFLEGSENEIQRLHFLRDTWEGLINVCHALVVSEARAVGLSLAAPARCGDILTDSPSTRLDTIERILGIAQAAGRTLNCTSIINLPLIPVIRELNQTRNAFSHTGAISEEQAKAFIEECRDDVLDVLDGFSALSQVRLIRYDRLDGQRLRHERFDGHSKTKRFDDLVLSPPVIAASAQLLTRDEVLVSLNGIILSVRPFLHFRPDAGGHFTQVAFFKKTRGNAPDRRIIFEIVGQSDEIDESRTPFQPAINAIRALFGETPE